MATRVVTFRQKKHMLKCYAFYLAIKRYARTCGSSAAVLATTVFKDSKNNLASKEQHSVMADMRLRTILESRFGWFNNHVPCFGVNGKNITVINEPMDFYETFKGMIRGAKKRIVIASLYLGTGAHEEELVKSIAESCQKAAENHNDGFEVHILLDYNRGSRGAKSSCTMLLPLLEHFNGQVHVYLYHTPDLRGLMKNFMSERFNEIVGLNHMKIYLADDDFIISGANLSDSYFTNRQDRYIQFRSCPLMADYFLDLVKAVSKFSFHLQQDNSMTYPSNTPHPYEGSDSPDVFKNFARNVIQNVMKTAMLKTKSKLALHSGDVTFEDKTMNSDIDTWLFPLIQMGPYQITDDEKVTQKLFRQSEECDTILLASGYFNLTNQYIDAILNSSKAKFEILTASPEANGFLGSNGISGYVPDVYTHVAKNFHGRVCQLCQKHRISLYEYYRKHWTFHCKGLWYYLPDSDLPVMTFIGSPNFGYRSVYRDLECQVVVMTTNESLQQQLQEEHKRLYSSSVPVKEETFQRPDRYVPIWVRLATKIVKNFF